MNTIMTPDSISSNSDTTRNDVVTINDRTDAETFLRRQTVESDKMIGRGGDSISSPGYNADPEGSAMLQQRYAAAGGGGSMADEYYYQQRHQQQ